MNTKHLLVGLAVLTVLIAKPGLASPPSDSTDTSRAGFSPSSTTPVLLAQAKSGPGDPALVDRLIVFPGATIRHGEAWARSAVQYVNAEEWIRLDTGADGLPAAGTRLARALITTERRTSVTDALRRLQD